MQGCYAKIRFVRSLWCKSIKLAATFYETLHSTLSLMFSAPNRLKTLCILMTFFEITKTITRYIQKGFGPIVVYRGGEFEVICLLEFLSSRRTQPKQLRVVVQPQNENWEGRMKAIYLLSQLKLLKIFKSNETQSQLIQSLYKIALK